MEKTKYCIAYKSDTTVEHADRTGNLAGGWVRISAWIYYDEAYTYFKREADNHKNAIIGMFVSHENELTAWYDRKPMKARDNRDKSGWPIVGLEGLINSRSSSDL